MSWQFGAGPIGLAAILTAALYTPGRIVAIDLADSRLETARLFGGDTTIRESTRLTRRRRSRSRPVALRPGVWWMIALP